MYNRTHSKTITPSITILSLYSSVKSFWEISLRFALKSVRPKIFYSYAAKNLSVLFIFHLQMQELIVQYLSLVLSQAHER